VEKIATTVRRALGTYGTVAMEKIIQNCMAQDFSWKVSICETFVYFIAY